MAYEAFLTRTYFVVMALKKIHFELSEPHNLSHKPGIEKR